LSINTDLFLEPKLHDLFIKRYDLSLVSGLQSTGQRLKVKLKLFFSEWYLNRLFGVPYYQDILKKAPDLILIEARLKEAILKTPLVIEILQFALDFDVNQRRLFVNFSVRTAEGNLTIIEDVGI
jgi:hypothetical protein